MRREGGRRRLEYLSPAACRRNAVIAHFALAALADPTRRRVFERLKSGPKAVGVIARGLPVSRPAVSQHLKVLKEASLVADRPEGACRVYYIDHNGLGALRAWLDQFWDQALARFQDAVELGVGKEKDKFK